MLFRFCNRAGRALPALAIAALVAIPAVAHAQEGTSTTTDGVEVSEYLTVDIFVQDEDLGNVLQMLSKQTKKNIVASKDVSGTVTANFYNVTFYEALENILAINGFGYREDGNFIYVLSREELVEMEKAQRKVESRVIQLNYLNAADAASFVEPLLSDAGTIKASGDAPEFSIPDDTPTGSEDFALSATLVIYDYAEHIDEIVKLLEQLDTRPAQVLVEATIVQTSLNEANAFGVDFAFLNGLDFVDFFNFGGPLGTADALGQLTESDVAPVDNRATGVVTRQGNFAAPGTIKAAIIHDDIAFFIRALDEVTDVTVLSNPKILALNRQSARVLVGRKLGYLSTTSTETATTQTVEFLDTGTQLNFRPFVSNDGIIRLELKPRVSEGIIREQTDATGAGVTIPDEITQEITTNVMVPDGATVVLGGLFREQTRLVRRQVPVLGDLPVLGNAFRGFDDSTDRSEIIFLIKPTVVNDRVLLTEAELAMDHAERIRVGSRQGLLPFSRDRQTAQLNVMAERLAAEGELERANWMLRRSLELNPNQADALRLRERMSGQYASWPNRSLLNDYVHGQIADMEEELPNGTPPAPADPLKPMEPVSILPIQPIDGDPVADAFSPTPFTRSVWLGSPRTGGAPSNAGTVAAAPATMPTSRDVFGVGAMPMPPVPSGAAMVVGPDGNTYFEVPATHFGTFEQAGPVETAASPMPPASSGRESKNLTLELMLRQLAEAADDPATADGPSDESGDGDQVTSVETDEE